MNVSATTFIRNAFKGGFPVFESMATMLWLPIDEFVILDMGSDDGTHEILEKIAIANDRVRLVNAKWSRMDASAFADVANECVKACHTDNVLFYQADEVWHPALLPLIEEKWIQDEYDLSFWRIQLKTNFQEIKWWPHIIHRCIVKGESTYIGDGMNTDRTWDAKLVYDKYDAGWFTLWSDKFGSRPETLPWEEFVFDIHASFDLNMVEWKKLHAPFWHEPDDVIDGMRRDAWLKLLAEEQRLANTTTPYRLPPILEDCVGMGSYKLREELLEALLQDKSWALVEG